MQTPHIRIAQGSVTSKMIFFVLTLDNASNNGAMMKLIITYLFETNMLLGGGKLFHQCCAAHVIHFLCQDGLEFSLDNIIRKTRANIK
jgi:hypothetical protein